MSTRFLTVEEVLQIHRDQIQRYGGSLELRDAGLLDAAVSMPQQQFGGEFLHRDVPTMAASYLYHLTKNHPFVDGNKRVGAATANVFLRMNSHRLNCTNDEFADFVLRIAGGESTKDDAVAFFRQHIMTMGE